MRKLFLGCALLALLCGAAGAKELALPPKAPLVTLQIPNKWTVQESEFGYSTVSPDDSVTLAVEYAGKKNLDAMLKANKAWMKDNQINDRVKPEEREMDFNGTTGKVLRYNTTDANGDTIIDFVMLNAGENRVVMITLWGSDEERADHKAEIEAIMASVRISGTEGASGAAAGTGLGQAAREAAAGNPKAAPKAPEPAKPVAEAVPAPQAAPAPAVAPAPFVAGRTLFVTRQAADYGDVDARASTVFAPDDNLRTYMEVTGMATAPAGNGAVRIGLAVGYEIRGADGAVTSSSPAIVDSEIVVSEAQTKKVFFNNNITNTKLAPGAYTLTYDLRDRLDGRTARVQLPFTVAAAAPAPTAAAPPAAPAQDALCARDVVRADTIAAVNGAPDFKDGQRQIKELVDPETVSMDRAAKALTCRYTAVWTEKRDGTASERRMRMTFKFSENSKGESDMEYVFDK